MNYTIETLNENNIEEYVRTNAFAWKETYKGIVNDEFLDLINTEEEIQKSVERQKAQLQNETKRRFLLKVNNKPVGNLSIGISLDENFPNIGEIKTIYLLEEVKHQGYGKILFNKAVQELQKMNFKTMIISCLEENTNANEFYKQLGGNLVGTRPFTLPNQTLTENIYYFNIEKKSYQTIGFFHNNSFLIFSKIGSFPL